MGPEWLQVLLILIGAVAGVGATWARMKPVNGHSNGDDRRRLTIESEARIHEAEKSHERTERCLEKMAETSAQTAMAIQNSVNNTIRLIESGFSQNERDHALLKMEVKAQNRGAKNG
jgi:hypothetical protein